MTQPEEEHSENGRLGLGPYFLCFMVILQPLAWHPEYRVPAAFFATTFTAILILLIARRTDLVPSTTYLRGRYHVALGALLFGLNPIGNPFAACAAGVAAFIFCMRFFKKEGVFQRNIASLFLSVLFAFGTLSFNEYVYWIPRPVSHTAWRVLDALHEHDAECEKFDLKKKDFGAFSMDLVGERKAEDALGIAPDVDFESVPGKRYSFYSNGMKQILVVAPSPRLPPLVTEEFIQRRLAGGDYGDAVGEPRVDVRRVGGWVTVDLELTLITEDEIRPLKELYMSWGIMECGDRRALLLTKGWIAEAVSRRHLREVSKSSRQSFDCRIKADDNRQKPTCDIKGNISSKGVRIYHPSSCSHWYRTKIDPSKGEQYFCSHNDALVAGWRQCR